MLFYSIHYSNWIKITKYNKILCKKIAKIFISFKVIHLNHDALAPIIIIETSFFDFIIYYSFKFLNLKKNCQIIILISTLKINQNLEKHFKKYQINFKKSL